MGVHFNSPKNYELIPCNDFFYFCSFLFIYLFIYFNLIVQLNQQAVFFFWHWLKQE